MGGQSLFPTLRKLMHPCGRSIEQSKRILSALVLLPPLVFFLVYAPPELFLCLVFAVVALGLREYFAVLAQRQQLLACTWLSYVVSFGLTTTIYLSGERWMSMALFVGIVGLTIGIIRTSHDASHLFPLLTYNLIGVLLISWTLSHFVLLRDLPTGQWTVLFLCLVVWVEDIVAMYAGKSLGRHKMVPALSPGKTWEGAVCGSASGVLVAILSAYFLLPHLSLWHSAILGLFVVVSAQVSDLGESMLKRYAGVKDSGGLIPGHGGLLDRIDSLLFATPTCFYVLKALGNVSAS